ncbi:E3 ubiquitin-protein ligase NHLRC1-like [Xiphias gladius]|uniref:E3 ubiquitin-protein ligase NHLRC1-like n=1 Tax=Xiphias gladius TaxID=8245 RepID=UPI001A98443C|nr:E3 ubiquitin-protein ligase NHLRC1-like [Xiphias gladius]XP_039974610.1 E3 ubiquitin-protein ligase NHLRC1-like [Xiphias gladius]XP_039974611.1 E3 ubiquitin-protein ligase NHLRC1-like [Xiphias gladius]
MAMSLRPRSCGSLSPEGILREIQINLLECKVCFEKFCTQQRERRPQNLSCGHVLCLECITALSHPLLRKLECPFCRQLCSVDSTSHCQVLSDLQELLLSRSPTSSAPPHRGAKGGFSLAAGLISTALHLNTAFGGWGSLINPTGIAVLGSSGAIVVVHDGEKSVVVFSPQGRKLHSFGRRGKASREICYPVDVVVTPCGYVVVTDAGDKAVKVFTSRGNHVLTVKDSFQMPWGVDTNSCGHLLVSDVQAGTLFHIKVDYSHGVTLEHHISISDLQQPKAVACCRVTGNTAVMEHLTADTHPPERQHHTRLKVFTKDFHILYQTDSFSLSLQSTVRLNMSGVAFDRNGDVVVTDSKQGMIWILGKFQDGPVLTPLVGDHLIRPVGLVSLNNMLIILDSGEHAVKIYSAKSGTAPMI